MFKKLVIVCSLLSLFSVANAEILQMKDSIDNSKYIYSLSPKQPLQFPKYFMFKKIINNNSKDYFLTIQNDNGVTKTFSCAEYFKMTINDKDIYTFLPTFSDVSGGKQATIHLSNAIITNFNSINKIVFKIPIFAERSSKLSSYYYFEVPQPILDEWKQVITME
jgi:hypothetical protein